MKCSLVFVLCVFGLAAAFESYIPNSKHADHPGKCYHKKFDYVFAVDEVFKPVEKDMCNKYTCQEEYLIRVNVCPKYSTPANCVAHPGDSSAAYPDCCVILKCTENGKEVIMKTATD